MANPPVKSRLNAVNKRLKDWESDGKSWVIIKEGLLMTIDSFEQTQRKDDGIDKSQNIDHMTDAIGYYIAKKYPVITRKIRTIQW